MLGKDRGFLFKIVFEVCGLGGVQLCTVTVNCGMCCEMSGPERPSRRP